MRTFAVVLGALLWSEALAGVNPADPQVTLQGDHFKVTLSRRTGRLTSVARQGQPNLLSRPVVVSIRDEVRGRTRVLSGPLQHVEEKQSSVSFSQRLPDLGVETAFQAGHDLSIGIEFHNKTIERRDISIWFDFDSLPRDSQAFLPGVYPHPDREISAELTYGYRAEGLSLVIPAATFFSKSIQTGLTALSPLAIPVQGFQVQLLPSSGARIGRTDLRLEPHGTVQTQIFLAVHEPDWRPGLGFILGKYPEHFTAHNATAVDINGPFLWSPTAPEEQVRQWRDQGVRWVEVHFTYPFLGKYFPDERNWVPAMDDHWGWEKMRHAPSVPALDAPFALIKRYLDEVLTPWETPERVRAFIRLLHKYDIKALMYFQPSECWDRYAVEQLLSDTVHDASGALVPAWYEDIVLNPRPGSEWAKYLEQQFKQLLALYPEADGIFEDQSHYDILDYAHDDGFSIRHGRTAHRMGYSICLLISRLSDYAHSLGKTVWWNGPYQIELGAIGDGHLAEGSDEHIQWLGIGNVPITSGAWYPDLYDRALLMGSQPASPSLTPISFPNRYAKEIPADAKVPPDQLADFERYAPLFEQIRRREWVLTPDAVSVPPGFEANIFRKPDGNYAVPVVTTWGGPSTGTELDLPVAVRVPDGDAIRGAYILKAELGGWFRAPWKREGPVLKIWIPRHHRASVIVLAKTGFYAALNGDGTLVEGKGAAAGFILDNWQSEQARGEVHMGDSTKSFDLAPNASQSLPISVESVRPAADDKVSVPIRVTFASGQGELAFQQQIVSVPSLEVGWEGTLRGYVGQTNSALFYVQNRSNTALNVNLEARGAGLQITGLPSTVHLGAGAQTLVKAAIRPIKGGVTELHLLAAASGKESTLRIKLPVWRSRFNSRSDVVGGRIEFEQLVPDGMPDLRRGEADIFAPFPGAGFGSSLQSPPAIKARRILIDGRPVGYLPSLNQMSWRGMAVSIPEWMLLNMAGTLQISFLPADAGDAYRLRNIQVVLNLSGGSEQSSAILAREYATKPAGESEAKPILLRVSLPTE